MPVLDIIIFLFGCQQQENSSPVILPTEVPANTSDTTPTSTPTPTPTNTPTPTPTPIPVTDVSKFEYEVNDDNTVTIVKFLDTTLKEVIVPSYINGLPVTKIEPNEYNSIYMLEESREIELERLVLPEHLVEIGFLAFSGCHNLKTVVWNDSLEKINRLAFAYCNSIETLDFPNSLKRIMNQSFLACTSVTKMHLPTSLEYFAEDVFQNCPQNIEGAPDFAFSLTETNEIKLMHARNWDAVEITIPEEINGYPVTILGGGAFAYMEQFTSIKIPDFIKEIESSCFLEESMGGDLMYTFQGCESLVNIQFPSNCTWTGISTFCMPDCSSITEIVVPDTVTELNFYAFGGCSSLERITLNKNLTVIPNAAFSSCTSLKELVLPEGITTIEYAAFKNCTALEKLVIPESVTEINDRAFYSCKKVVFYTTEGSYADTFAKENNIEVVYQ